MTTIPKNVPKNGAASECEIYFKLGDEVSKNKGALYKSCEFKGAVNNGYIVKITLFDFNFATLSELINMGYLAKSREQVLQVKFKMMTGTPRDREYSTAYQVANVISLEAKGRNYDEGYLEFIAVDQVSWYLNIGSGTGNVFRGNVSDAIKQAVNLFANNNIDIEISETRDSKENRWGMMRQDPITFIRSLLDWSSSINEKKTQWTMNVEGAQDFGQKSKVIIKEQGQLQSVQRGFYQRYGAGTQDTILNWRLLSDNALSITAGKLVTQGASATTGEYYDSITDGNERFLFAKDKTTSYKKIARTNELQSTKKPDDSTGRAYPFIGLTSISSIPEHNAGDIGIPYKNYIDGKARSTFLDLNTTMMNLSCQVPGHGEYYDTRGMGIDTVFLRWIKSSENDANTYFLNGNWIVNGFHHVATKKKWFTYLLLSRYDYNSESIKVPDQPIN